MTQREVEILDRIANCVQDQAISWLSGKDAVSIAEMTLFVGDETSGAYSFEFPNSSAEELSSLYALATPAAFGRGQETVLDPSYRRGRTLTKDKFAINLAPDPGFLQKINSLMLDDDEFVTPYVRTELYRVNIYGPGDFFKEHKDTPQAGSGHFGSLVYCLPTTFEGGAFILRDLQGQEIHFDWAADITTSVTGSRAQDLASNTSSASSAITRQSSAAIMPFLAFATDLDHWVEPVTSGFRVTVTFHLFREIMQTEQLVQPVVESHFQSTEAVQAAIALKSSGVLDGKRVLFPTVHIYSARDNSKLALKGGDAALFQLLKMLGVNPKVMFYYNNRVNEDDEEDREETLRDEAGEEEYERGEEWCYLTDVVRFYTDTGLQEDEDGEAILDLADIRRVIWARKTMKNTYFFSVGGSYGNEPTLNHYYGNACIMTMW